MTIEPAPIGDFIDCFRAIVALETDIVRSAGVELGTRGGTFAVGARTALEILGGRILHGRRHPRKAAVNAMAQFMARFDLLLTPTVPVLPFAVDLAGPGAIEGTPVADDAWTPALYPANLTGQPAASVPAGWTDDGLPVGLQIIGRHLADRTVLAAAAAFEACRPWKARTPPLCR